MKNLLKYLHYKKLTISKLANKVKHDATKLETEAETLAGEISQFENNNFYKIITTTYHSIHLQCSRPKADWLFNFEVEIADKYNKELLASQISPVGFAHSIYSLTKKMPDVFKELKEAMNDELILFEYLIDNSTGHSTSFKKDEKGSELLEKYLTELMEIKK